MRSNVQYPLGGITAPVISPRGFSLRRLLFSASEPGFTFEPWDITTLYQDRAGTTPVTAAGQSVGLRLDKSKGLALGPELATNGDFSSDTAWSKEASWTISGGTANKTAGAAGSLYQASASMVQGRTYQITFTVSGVSAGTLTPFCRGTVGVGVTANGTYTQRIVAGSDGVYAINFYAGATFVGSIDNISVRELAGNHEVAINDAARGIYGWMPKTGRRNKLNATDTLATQSVTVTAAAHTLAFTGTGTVTLSGTSTAGPLVGTGAGNRVTLTFTPTAGSLTLTVTGSVTLAQLQLGSVDTAYQRVVSNYDVTEAGVPSCYYVLANGVNTAYVTPTITPGTDKVQVFAGVRKNSDAAAGTVIELSDTADSNNGTLFLRAPQAAAANYIFRSRGTVVSNVISPSSYAAPITNVVTGLGDIAGDVSRIHVNGSQVAESLTDQGTGNYLAYPAYIYARGGTTLPFNGYDFGHVERFGPNLDAATIARVESLLARNTPEVTL